MRAYQQLFFDNKINDYSYSVSGKERIDNGIGRLLNTLIHEGYNIKRVILQRHQSVFLLVKNIDSTEYTVEIKYGEQVASYSRFVQISTELNNSDWDEIEKIANEIFLEEGVA